MQVVINIPEDTYEYYAKLANKGEQLNNLESIILDGMPLPQEHGRLIDADEMIDDLKRQCREIFQTDAVKPEDYYIKKNAKFMEDTWINWCESFYRFLEHRPVVVKEQSNQLPWCFTQGKER
jgi:hypothetical protein